MTDTFNVSELDFDAIKGALKQFLSSNQSRFKDFNFEGSGMSVLLDVLSYNTHYNAFYINMLANEAFLDSAVTRDAVVSRAKELGYVPMSMRGAVANVALIVTPPNGNTISTLTISSGTKFLSEAIDGVNYPFVTLDSYTVGKNLVSNTFSFGNVKVYQGELQSYNFPVDGVVYTPASVFSIPDAGIDTSTLTVSVQKSGVDLSTNVYALSSDFNEIDGNTNAFFLQEGRKGCYGVYFGDGNIGKPISNGNIVICTYLSTDGPLANGANVFSPISLIGGTGGFVSVVSTNETATGGSDREQISTIKLRAPISHAAQGRGVTSNDFKSVVLEKYGNYIDQVASWGGEENNPVVYGKVFLSIKPRTGFALTNVVKNEIISTLENNLGVVTVTPVIVDPVYLFVLVNSTVTYDPSKTTLGSNDIATNVRQSILDFASDNFDRFDVSSLRLSKLQAAIDATDSSIESNETKIVLQKQLVPTLNTSGNYTVEFNAPLKRGGGSIGDKLYTYPSMQAYDASGVLREIYIEEVPESFTGVQRIEVLNPGYGYTQASVVISGDGSGANAYPVIQNGTIVSANVDIAGLDYSIASVTVEGDGTGATLSAVLNQQTGYLRSFYYDSTTNQKVVLSTNIGTIDYINGIIRIYGLAPVSITANPFYDSGVLTFNIPSDNQTVKSVRNSIVLLDTSNPLAVSVKMVSANASTSSSSSGS